MRRARVVLFAAAMLPAFGGRGEESGQRIPFYVGTYTRPGGSRGIYHYELNLLSGNITGGELAAETANPSFLASDAGARHLYATSETGAGAVTAFAIEKNGRLKRLNEQPSGGAGPTYLSVDGKNVLVANYGGGSVAVLPIDADGSLKPFQGFQQHHGSSANPRQKEPHPHGIYTDREDRFAYVPDLGLDKVMIYRFDAEHGKLLPNDPAFAALPPGSGPRHLAFDYQRNLIFVINELSNAITVFHRDAVSGGLQSTQTISTLGGDFTGMNTAAEIVLHPNAPFVYASNRGEDSIAAFSLDANGKLAFIARTHSGGAQPRSIAVDPSGGFLLAANQSGNDVVVFRIDRDTGTLKQAGNGVPIDSPACVLFPPVLILR